MTKEIKIGGVTVGGGARIAIQSMTNTDTADAEATSAQIAALEAAGCEIVRVAAYSVQAARAIAHIKRNIPLVADIHFDYKLAVAAIEAGADKIRINPGNIGGEEKIAAVVDAARAHGVPIRVGANTGSLMREYASLPKDEALVRSALDNVRILEKRHFYDIVVSLKASSAPLTVAACRRFAEVSEYPQHLGVTEAGAERSSLIKSAMGIGSLLMDGIGDTIRVSITGDPVSEVFAAKDILRYAGVRRFGAEVISCPTCARTKIDVEALAKRVEALAIDKPIKIAVMGCAVNGPGEAADADYGIAGGDGEGLIFAKGKAVIKLPQEQLIDKLLEMIERGAED